MKKNAAVKVHEEFTWDAIVSKQYIPLYDKIIEKK
jgi:hypothetical protein